MKLSEVTIDFKAARLAGTPLKRTTTTLEQSRHIYLKQDDREAVDHVIYEVEYHDNNVLEGDHGGLFFGISHIYPGLVGNEYHMTKGHIHLKKETGEYYWGLSGQGLLLLTFGDGNSAVQKVFEGSLHYIPGNTSHRLINCGEETLSVGACWLSESGHDYDNCIFKNRVIKNGDGVVEIIKCTSEN